MSYDVVDVAGSVTPDPQLVSFAELVAQLALKFVENDGKSISGANLAQQIVSGALDTIAGVLAAAVVVVDPAGMLQVAVMDGDEIARTVMDQQNLLGEGPCLDAARTREQIVTHELQTESRWPSLAKWAAAAGLRSMVCTPMVVNKRLVGVLALLARGGAGTFDDEVESAARVFAAHAGLALSGARTEREMQSALDGRDVIGQAKGILMERFKVTPDVAFAMLVRTSANTNSKLRAVCDELCLTGMLLPDPPKSLPRRRSAKD